MLNVGMSPGLTNLMARHAANLLDRTDAIDIALLFGLGDQHGKAGVEWIVDNLGLNFHVMEDGKPVAVVGFSDGKTANFGTELGKWRAYRYNFSDQHSLSRTLGVPSVSTRMCLDNRALNKALTWAKATGLTKLLHIKRIRDAAVHLFGSIRFGKETAAIKIDAWDARGHEDVRIECFMLGSNESVITGKVAAFVGDMLYRFPYDHGIYHIEQQFDLESLLTRIDQTISIETRMNGNVI